MASSLSTLAQNERGFFSIDSASINKITTMLVENTVNKYQFERIFPRRNNVEFWYRGEDHTLLRMLFKFFPDRSATLVHVDGKFVDVFPFWKKYFQPGADQKTLETNHEAEEANIPFAKGTATFGFRRSANPMWQISIIKITPVSPENQLRNEP